MSLAEARGARDAGRFEPVPRFPPTFGFGTGAYWFHLRVANVDHPDPDWIVAIAYALLDEADLYVVHGDGRIAEFRSGDRVPFAQRALAHRHITFPVRLPRGASAELYLRVRTDSSVQVPIELLTVTAFLARAPTEHLGLGVYYGIMLGLFFYNLVLFVSVRDRTFLWYVVYVGTFAFGQLCLNGLAFEYLWPEHPDWANDAVIVSIALGMIAMLVFTRSFLDLPRTYPGGDRLFRAIVALLAGVVLLSPLLGYRAAILIETAHVFVIAAAILLAALKVYRDGFKPARNFLLAWTVLLLGVVVYAALSFGLLPKMFITEYGIQIGSAAEMILLSFALAYRINTLRDENARLQREAREQLEARVAERTRDLDEALQKLQSVNRMLQEFSLRDGLTGAHNRRFFDQALTETWERARRERRPLSLVMVDIDHFKQINDRHGHLVGDDCLRALSQALHAQLRPDADERIVRYGGEEFVLILPDADAADAAQRAEGVRRAAAELRVQSEGVCLGFTVSAGVATFRPDDRAAHTDLLRATDRALYEAKRLGRNRVVTSE
jgi:diguanylate cyclase (GGDEF)-like protein